LTILKLYKYYRGITKNMKKLLTTLAIVGFWSELSAECLYHNLSLCKSGDGVACYNAGLMYENGFIKKDRCDCTTRKSCSSVEALYAASNCANFTHKNPDYHSAIKLYKKSMSLGYAEGYLGLGVLYTKGDGVKKSFHKAKHLFNTACSLGNDVGCYNYDLIIREGF